LLSSDLLPAAISLPHPGTSYNPTQSAHQALLADALTQAEREEAESSAMKALRAKTEAMREANSREVWEAAEEDVGSGSEVEAGEQREELVFKQKKPKTAKERRRRAENILREVRL
jgi:nucleolar protein 53